MRGRLNAWRSVVKLALVLVAGPAAAGEVIGEIPFNTGPFACDGSPQYRWWTNTYPFAMRVKRLRLILNRDYGVIADYHSEVNRSDGSRMAWWSQDAYAEAGQRIDEWSYGEDYQTLNPGDYMWLYALCTQFGGPPGRGHTIVFMLYERVP